MKLTDSEKLIVALLCDIHKGLKVKGELDADFIAKALYGEQLWALKWQLSGVFGTTQNTDPPEVGVVVNHLEMWDILERSHEKLSKGDKARLATEAAPLGEHVRFTGYDGNGETRHMGIARFLVEDLGRFSRFKGRDMNSHMPSIDSYDRMYRAYEPFRRNLGGGHLSADQMIAVLSEFVHPSNRKKKVVN